MERLHETATEYMRQNQRVLRRVNHNIAEFMYGRDPQYWHEARIVLGGGK
jgi:hypothetical protein